VFTGRWPESVSQQNEFAGYLDELVTGLERAKSSKFTAWDLNQWLRAMFGDRVVTAAADRLADELGKPCAKPATPTPPGAAPSCRPPLVSRLRPWLVPQRRPSSTASAVRR
jgi:hypothetical protein